MIFTPEGLPLQGLAREPNRHSRSTHYAFSGITGGDGGDRRVEHIIPREAVERGTYEVVIESSSNGMFGVPWGGDIVAPPDVRQVISFLKCCLFVDSR